MRLLYILGSELNITHSKKWKAEALGDNPIAFVSWWLLWCRVVTWPGCWNLVTWLDDLPVDGTPVFEQPDPTAQTGSHQDATPPMQHHLIEWVGQTSRDRPPQEIPKCVGLYQVRLGYCHPTQSAHCPPGPQHHQVKGQHHISIRRAPHQRYLQNHPQSRGVRAPQTVQHHLEPPGTPRGQSSQRLTGRCSVLDPMFRLWCRICRWDWEEPPQTRLWAPPQLLSSGSPP